MVHKVQPTALGIKGPRLLPQHPAAVVEETPLLRNFMRGFADDEFTAEKKLHRRSVFGVWHPTELRAADDEHPFESQNRPDTTGFRTGRPTPGALADYVNMLMDMFPGPTVLLTPTESAELASLAPTTDQRLVDCRNILFLFAAGKRHYRFGDFDREEGVLWIADPCEQVQAEAADLSLLGLTSVLQTYAKERPDGQATGAEIQIHYMDARVPVKDSWAYAMKAARLWFEARDSGGIRDADDSSLWRVSAFSGEARRDIEAVSSI
jgi:hypothetical protein